MMIITNNRSMYRIVLICIAIILSSISVDSLFAADACTFDTTRPSFDELLAANERCITARATGKANSITDFMCPQGNFYDDNNQSITSETVPYLIAVNLSFNKIDAEISRYMRKLQEKREPSPTVWEDAIDKCTAKIKTAYDDICQFGALEATLYTDPNNKIIVTTRPYPQSLCQVRATQKLQWWRYLQYIMMSDSISKNQKNSTDKWITEVKWAYARVLWSWHNYKGMLATAVSKLTGLPKNSN